ncbi:Adenine deaminase [Dirofilaria immitis]
MVHISTVQDPLANSSIASRTLLMVVFQNTVENRKEDSSKLLVSSSESSVSTVYGPLDVIAKIEQLLLDAINQAEMALKQLPQYPTKIMISAQNFNRIEDLRKQSVSEIADEEKLKGKTLFFRKLISDRFVSKLNISFCPEYQPFITGSFEISAPLLLNERPGVRYFCCDRFFKCDGRNLVAREIWPSDGGCIELNREELKRFIVNNEARRLNGSKVSRYVAGGSSREYITNSKMQQSLRNTMVVESNIKSDFCEVLQPREGILSKSLLIQTFKCIIAGKYNTIIETPDTLISSPPDTQPSSGMCGSFESLNDAILELKVLIENPKEPNQFNIKIDCHD